MMTPVYSKYETLAIRVGQLKELVQDSGDQILNEVALYDIGQVEDSVQGLIELLNVDIYNLKKSLGRIKESNAEV